MKIFVFGTLKRGFRLNGWMKESKYIGNGKLLKYKMYSNGSYPTIVKSDNDDDIIFGEVFNVTKDVFEPISLMERNAGYSIDKVDVIMGDKKINVPVFAMTPKQVDNEGWRLIRDGIFSQ